MVVKYRHIISNLVFRSNVNILNITNKSLIIRSFSSKSKRNSRETHEHTFITSPGQDRWMTLGDNANSNSNGSNNSSLDTATSPGNTNSLDSTSTLDDRSFDNRNLNVSCLSRENSNLRDNINSLENTDNEDKLMFEEYNMGLNENLTPEQEKEKAELIKELTKRLRGPLADENGNIPTGDKRPIAIEVDGPSHFYANSTNYTAYTKLKHRLLTRMGYKVLHVPYFEWRRLRGAREREDYMRAKLSEEPTEWLDPEDEKFYAERLDMLKQQFSAAANTTNDVKDKL